MRPIDSDALKRYMCNKCGERSICEYYGFGCGTMADIDEQPTIEAKPVKHGEWIFQGHRDSEGRNIYCCSNCDFYKYVFPYNVASWRAREKHCPSCGAKMDGGAD